MRTWTYILLLCENCINVNYTEWLHSAFQVYYILLLLCMFVLLIFESLILKSQLKILIYLLKIIVIYLCKLVLRASFVAHMVKNLPTMKKTQVWSLDQKDPLEEEMATHSSLLAWRIPWTEESGWLQSMGSQRMRHDWVTNSFIFNLVLYFLSLLYMCYHIFII